MICNRSFVKTLSVLCSAIVVFSCGSPGNVARSPAQSPINSPALPSDTGSHNSFAKQNTKQAPNIIFIMADDLGYGDLGIYGQSRIKTPHLDELAQEGIKFNQHYAGSTVCGPSRASFLTGLHPGHSPIRGNPRWTASGTAVEIQPQDVTVGEVLQDAGYQTAVIGKWAMADRKEFNLSAMPLQNGFDYFFGYKTHKDAHHYYWDKLYRNNDEFIVEGNDYWNRKGKYTHDLFTEDALRYVSDVDKSKPFFLFLAYTIPHLAMTVPEDSKTPYQNLGWRKREMKNSQRPGSYRHDPEGHTAYAGMVSRMDRDIGALIDRLEALGIDDNTLIVFTSDNGHEFDKVDNEFFNSNGPLRGKKRDLYEGGIRVPFIAKWPGKIPAGSVSEHPSTFWDFMATACELADSACPPNDGISYVPALAGFDKRQEKHDLLYWEFNERAGPIQAVRQGNWKLIKFKQSQRIELYDLSQDIGEKNDLSRLYPEIVAQLLPMLEQARTAHPEFPLVKKKQK